MKRKGLINMLTINQSADLVGVSRQTIYDWIKTGFLGYTQLGHVRLINKDALLAASEVKRKRQRGRILRRGEKKEENNEKK
jgi:excisionase family DNA binding protein